MKKSAIIGWVVLSVLLAAGDVVATVCDENSPKDCGKHHPYMILTGSRSRDSIFWVVLRNIKFLRYAYNKRVSENPDLYGRRLEVSVKFAIDEFGKVIFAMLAESTANDTTFENTVVNSVKDWDFVRIDKPGDTTVVTYRLIFSQ